MRILLPALCLAAVSQHATAFAAPAQKSKSSNEIIADAEHYTVKIRTLGEVGLNRDNGGSSTGTGFLVDKARGWIMTNAHVATRSPARITVAFKGEEFHQVKRIFVDSEFDVAILEIDRKYIPTTAQDAELDCDKLPEKGTAVAIYGHPGSLFFTATRGIVSSTPWLWSGEVIQSDATINGGNSGGPLINLESGKIVGVASASLRQNQDNNAMVVSLSEPMVHLCPILHLLKNQKNPQVRQLPIAYATGDDDYRPVVAELFDANLKLERGDIIKGVNGKMEVRNSSDLSTRLRGQEGEVILNIERNGKMIDVKAHADPVPDVLKAKALDVAGIIITQDWAMDKQWSPDSDKLIVDYIRRNSPAVMTAAAPNQQIVSVDKKLFNSLESLESYLKSRGPKDKINFILRSPLYQYSQKWLYYTVVLERGEIKPITASDDMFKN